MNRTLSCALALGLALRLGAVFLAGEPPLVADATLYADTARNIALRGEYALKAGEPSVNRGPLYPFFLSFFARLSPSTWAGARVAQAFLDTSSIYLLYVFGLFALGKSREAAVGALLYAVHPVFIAYSAQILSETLFFWIWLVALLLLLKADEEAPPLRAAAAAAASGVAMGLGILCRPNFILFPAAASVVLLAVYRKHSGLPRRLCITVAFAYVTLIPWMARNRMVMGHWVVAVGGGLALLDGAQIQVPARGGNAEVPNLSGTEYEIDAEMARLAQIAYKRDALAIFASVPRRTASFWLTSHSALFGIDESIAAYRAQGRWPPILARAALWLLHLTLLLVSGWGLWLSRKSWTMGCTLTITAIAYYSLHIFFAAYWMNRYHLPALILCLSFAGAAISRLADRILPATA